MKSNVKSWVWRTNRRLNRFKQSAKLCLIKDYRKVGFWALDLMTDILEARNLGRFSRGLATKLKRISLPQGTSSNESKTITAPHDHNRGPNLFYHSLRKNTVPCIMPKLTSSDTSVLLALQQRKFITTGP